jgi:hypothetical protein
MSWYQISRTIAERAGYGALKVLLKLLAMPHLIEAVVDVLL